jgi:hypothetical protein
VLLRAANIPHAALNLRVELGGAAERLADIAAREGAQLIVNGSRGRGARSRLLGSVSSCLALTASQPLVLVQPGRRAAVVAEGRNNTRSGHATRRTRRVQSRSTSVRDVAVGEATGRR